MTVYVDKLRKWGYVCYRGHYIGPHWCHMTADNLDELHAMASLIGLKPHWFQNKRIPHYDLTPSRRKLAVMHGAKEIE